MILWKNNAVASLLLVLLYVGHVEVVVLEVSQESCFLAFLYDISLDAAHFEVLVKGFRICTNLVSIFNGYMIGINILFFDFFGRKISFELAIEVGVWLVELTTCWMQTDVACGFLGKTIVSIEYPKLILF